MSASTFTTPAVSEAGKAIALAVVLALAVTYVPLASILALPLLPLPVAYLTKRRGLRVGLAAAFGTGALAVMLTGPGNGLLALFLAGLVAVAMGWAFQQQWGLSRALLATAGATAVSLAVWAGAVWMITGLDRERVGEMMDSSLQGAVDAYRALGMAEATIQNAEEQVRAVVDILPYLLPSILGVAGLAFAVAALGLAALIFPRVGESLPGVFAFSRFRIHWSAAYGFIAGLGLMLAARYAEMQEPFRMAGLNLIVFFQSLFFIQGLAVVHWYTVSRKVAGGRRALIYAIALMSQFFLQLVSWAGLLDTWFDYRERFAPRPTDGESGAPEMRRQGPGRKED